MNFTKRILIKVVILLGFSVSVVPACSVCFGNPDSSMVLGMNRAIMFLMAVIGTLLVSFAAFFIYLNLKAKSVQNAEGNLHA